MVTNGSTGLAQSNGLRVRGRVGVGDVAVPAAAHDAAFADDDCADGNFRSFECALGAAERFLHPELVRGSGRGCWVVGLRTFACGGFLAGHLGGHSALDFSGFPAGTGPLPNSQRKAPAR